MAKRGKKIRAAREVAMQGVYELAEAVRLCKQHAFAKFDESVDMAVRLGVNPRHADQMVRGSVVLPKGLGKSVRVVAFARGEKEIEAREAGADLVGADDLIQRIQGGWLEFDRVVATPDMMGTVGKVGKILGPRGLMPNPKTGSVTFEIGRAIQEAKAGKLEFRVDRQGILHSPIGRASFSEEDLLHNARALLETLLHLKPASSKGQYMRGISVSSTMGAGFRVDPMAVVNELG